MAKRARVPLRDSLRPFVAEAVKPSTMTSGLFTPKIEMFERGKRGGKDFSIGRNRLLGSKTM
jgi:hypothetical protein